MAKILKFRKIIKKKVKKPVQEKKRQTVTKKTHTLNIKTGQKTNRRILIKKKGEDLQRYFFRKDKSDPLKKKTRRTKTRRRKK